MKIKEHCNITYIQQIISYLEKKKKRNREKELNLVHSQNDLMAIQILCLRTAHASTMQSNKKKRKKTAVEKDLC